MDNHSPIFIFTADNGNVRLPVYRLSRTSADNDCATSGAPFAQIFIDARDREEPRIEANDALINLRPKKLRRAILAHEIGHYACDHIHRFPSNVHDVDPEAYIIMEAEADLFSAQLYGFDVVLDYLKLMGEIDLSMGIIPLHDNLNRRAELLRKVATQEGVTIDDSRPKSKAQRKRSRRKARKGRR